jgi:hypothetical protein
VLLEFREAAIAVDQCVEAPVYGMTDTDLVASLDAVYELECRIAAVKAHLVREVTGRGLPLQHGVRSMPAWLMGRYRIGLHTAKRAFALSGVLDASPVLDHAVAAGEVNPEQAVVIGKAVNALPEEVRADLAADAEATLVEQAASLDPYYLGKVGDHLLSIVAPQLAEALEAKALEKLEAQAHAARSLTLSRHGDGQYRISGNLDVEGAAFALRPLSKPAGQDTRTAAQRRADAALVEVCKLALRVDQVPATAGDTTTVVVTTDVDTLRTAYRTATLDTGDTISATTLRRWCCNACFLPAVLNTAGAVLDVGRASRLVTLTIRRALALRDRGCSFPGCELPNAYCDAHHITEWHDGGPTCLDNLALLCGFHHRLIHTSDWQIRLGTDRRPEFLPPSFMDPDRAPRRNILHRRT